MGIEYKYINNSNLSSELILYVHSLSSNYIDLLKDLQDKTLDFGVKFNRSNIDEYDLIDITSKFNVKLCEVNDDSPMDYITIQANIKENLRTLEITVNEVMETGTSIEFDKVNTLYIPLNITKEEYDTLLDELYSTVKDFFTKKVVKYKNNSNPLNVNTDEFTNKMINLIKTYKEQKDFEESRHFLENMLDIFGIEE